MYKSVLDYFEETVQRVPQKMAVRHKEEECTFARLQEKASCFHSPNSLRRFTSFSWSSPFGIGGIFKRKVAFPPAEPR